MYCNTGPCTAGCSLEIRCWSLIDTVQGSVDDDDRIQVQHLHVRSSLKDSDTPSHSTSTTNDVRHMCTHLGWWTLISWVWDRTKYILDYKRLVCCSKWSCMRCIITWQLQKLAQHSWGDHLTRMMCFGAPVKSRSNGACNFRHLLLIGHYAWFVTNADHWATEGSLCWVNLIDWGVLGSDPKSESLRLHLYCKL